MNRADRLLLLRVATRMEERASEDYRAAMATSSKANHDLARRRRDREVGDAADLREFVKRTEAVDVVDTAALRLSYLVDGPETVATRVTEVYDRMVTSEQLFGAPFLVALDALIAARKT